ncbi:MAG: acylneuraminate cytidylyltransferase [Chloroflexota bacterium]
MDSVVAHGQQVLAIVQARGGSKGIPGKNVKLLAGVPLIAYSIAAGLQSKYVDRVIISTDDAEIAEVARQWGAEVPFLRPPEYATDLAVDLDLFVHALTWFEQNENYTPEIVVQLRPTTPLRPPDCVDRAIEILLSDPDATSVRGVVPSGQNPYKMWRVPAEGQPMQPLMPDEGFSEPYNMPRQKLPPTYWQTGHIDALRRHVILRDQSMSGSRVLPLIIDSRYAIDIDNLQDWAKAEWLLERLDVPFVNPKPTRGVQLNVLEKITERLKSVRLLVLDFDGVLTDNRVWTSEDGQEWVAANRSDGYGIRQLKAKGVEVMVLSREENPVVAARCRKLGIQHIQGVIDKPPALQTLVAERALTMDQVIYVGNDVNDLGCMQIVGLSVAVADAYPPVIAQADLVLQHAGGFGAVRELCDRIIELI